MGVVGLDRIQAASQDDDLVVLGRTEAVDLAETGRTVAAAQLVDFAELGRRVVALDADSVELGHTVSVVPGPDAGAVRSVAGFAAFGRTAAEHWEVGPVEPDHEEAAPLALESAADHMESQGQKSDVAVGRRVVVDRRVAAGAPVVHTAVDQLALDAVAVHRVVDQVAVVGMTELTQMTGLGILHLAEDAVGFEHRADRTAGLDALVLVYCRVGKRREELLRHMQVAVRKAAGHRAVDRTAAELVHHLAARDEPALLRRVVDRMVFDLVDLTDTWLRVLDRRMFLVDLIECSHSFAVALRSSAIERRFRTHDEPVALDVHA